MAMKKKGKKDKTTPIQRAIRAAMKNAGAVKGLPP